MSGELEAAGAMATAALAAGAIEGREAHGAGEGGCLNCGAELSGRYCSACGQAAHPHRSLAHQFQEPLHRIVHVDTQPGPTLPMVLFRPGTLTRNYVYGKRARYISPLALFLFTIFFMFAVFAFAGPGDSPVNVTESTTVAEAEADLTDARARLAEAQEAVRAVRESDEEISSAPGLAIDLAEQAIERAQTAVERREQALQRARAREATPVVGVEVAGAPTEVANEAEAGADLTWQDAAREVAESEDFTVVRGWDSLNHKVQEKLRNPDLAVYKIQQAAYKFSFLLIPISLPFIALLFLWKRGVTLYDHVVFSLYSLSFVSLLFVTIVAIGRLDALLWITPLLVTFAIPVHTYFHLKGAYALGWFSALWRTFFMLIFATVALTLFLITIVTLGLTG
jgi:hypothetical protein